MTSDLQKILEALRELEGRSISSRLDSPFLELTHADKPEELQIAGNKAGLLHMARVLVELAQGEVRGSHHHFDSAGIVDRCDIPVVVAFKPAPWDA